jgi:Spy/CpxP family protein refolding chaperone
MNRLPWILLMLSIAFNVTFMGGFFHARTVADSSLPEQADEDVVADKVADEMGLSAEQRTKFLSLRHEMEGTLRDLHEAIELAHEEWLAETSKPSPDPEAVAAAQDELTRLQMESRKLRFSSFQQFMGILTPEQRRRASERMGRGMHHHGPGKEDFLRRFDTNGDGVVDDAERENARQMIGKKHGGPSRRPGGPNGQYAPGGPKHPGGMHPGSKGPGGKRPGSKRPGSRSRPDPKKPRPLDKPQETQME